MKCNPSSLTNALTRSSKNPNTKNFYSNDKFEDIGLWIIVKSTSIKYIRLSHCKYVKIFMKNSWKQIRYICGNIKHNKLSMLLIDVCKKCSNRMNLTTFPWPFSHQKQTIRITQYFLNKTYSNPYWEVIGLLLYAMVTKVLSITIVGLLRTKTYVHFYLA